MFGDMYIGGNKSIETYHLSRVTSNRINEQTEAL